MGATVYEEMHRRMAEAFRVFEAEREEFAVRLNADIAALREAYRSAEGRLRDAWVPRIPDRNDRMRAHERALKVAAPKSGWLGRAFRFDPVECLPEGDGFSVRDHDGDYVNLSLGEIEAIRSETEALRALADGESAAIRAIEAAHEALKAERQERDRLRMEAASVALIEQAKAAGFRLVPVDGED